jgi:hypothetical protein
VVEIEVEIGPWVRVALGAWFVVDMVCEMMYRAVKATWCDGRTNELEIET